MSSWRSSAASSVICATVNLRTCAGPSTISRYPLIKSPFGGGVWRPGFEGRLARRVFFQLLNLQLRLLQFLLADLDQPRAFLEPFEQRFQREIARFHRFHDGFEFFQGLFKRQGFFGGGLTRVL